MNTMTPPNQPPVSQAPAAVRVPPWEQIPPEKRQELAQVLAEMLLKLLQAGTVKHEQPS
jgi:hypothetical protein